MSEKHVIWSDLDIDVEDWHDFLEEEYPDVDDEYEKLRLCYDMNAEYLEDEKMNLSKELGTRIVVIADLGLWYGRRSAYKVLDDKNLAEILSFYDGCDEHEWYVQDGEVRCVGIHHDGRNHYIFRALRSADEMDDETYDDIFYGNASTEVLMENSRSLAPDVCKVYGWTA